MSAFTTVNLYHTNTSSVVYKKGEIIFEAGDTGDVMYAILDGKVGLWIDQKLIETISAGDVFGEGALVQVNHTRGSQAIAQTDCQLLSLTESRFLFACENTPMFAVEVMRSFSTRLRNLKNTLSSSDSSPQLHYLSRS